MKQFNEDFLLQIIKNYDPDGRLDSNGNYINYSYHEMQKIKLKTKIAIIIFIQKMPDKFIDFLNDSDLFPEFPVDEVPPFLYSKLIELIENDKLLLNLLLNKYDMNTITNILFKYHDKTDGIKVLFKKFDKNPEQARKFIIAAFNKKIDYSSLFYDNYNYELFSPLINKIKNMELNSIVIKKLLSIFDYDNSQNLFDIWFYLCKNKKEKDDMFFHICDFFIKNNQLDSKKFVIIKRKLENGNISHEDFLKIFDAFNVPNIHLITSYLLTDSFILGDFNAEVQKEINIKALNQLIALAKEKFPSSADLQLHPDFGSGKIILKMMICLGEQRTKELLEGKYGDIRPSDLANAFFNFNVDDYSFQNKSIKYKPYQIELINFLFGSGQNEPNANIRKIISNDSPVSLRMVISNWPIIYNAMKTRGKMKLEEIANLINNKMESVLLRGYQKPIEQFIKEEGLDYLINITEDYDAMLQRYESTIPKVSGSYNDYEYEILDLDSIEQMGVGYATHCCFTFSGASHSSLHNALTSENSRIFVIRKNGKLVAQSWIWRDGNVLCFDDIEAVGVTRENDKDYIEVCQNAARQIIDISKQNELPEEQIEICTLGCSPNGIGRKSMEGLEKLDDSQTIIPLAGIYTDANVQYILHKSSSYTKTERFEPSIRYQDARSKAIYCDPQQSSKKDIMTATIAINKVNGLTQTNDFKIYERYTLVIYGKDWYIGVKFDGTIEVKECGMDLRRKEEIKENIDLLKKRTLSGELDIYLNDDIFNQTAKNHENSMTL